VLEVAVVNVGVDSEESFENNFDNLSEVLGKGDSWNKKGNPVGRGRVVRC
jgi:hypothetical protein